MHIKERQWHDSQEIQDQPDEPDGSIIFSAETAGIHDIRIWVLSWGSKARVLAPENLKEMITSEIEALNRLYE
jgi:predicted DNA-binding transcriptional regulator YafY